MSLGERAPVALLDFAASARLAVGEALTNIAATQIGELKRIKLSANWMSAAGHPGEDAGLYDAVRAVGEELCPALEITIPVGKDSMSMKTRWQEGHEQREMTSPLSLVITAFARIEDVRRTVTPQLRTDKGDNALLLIDLGAGHNALGATALTQVYRQLGDKPADVRNVQQLAGFFNAMQRLVADQHLLAYHDRSDGGLLVTLAEMAFAGHCGVTVDIQSLGNDALAALFNEELGAVIQVVLSSVPTWRNCWLTTVWQIVFTIWGVRLRAIPLIFAVVLTWCTARNAALCACGGQKRAGKCSVCVIIRIVLIKNIRLNRMKVIPA